MSVLDTAIYTMSVRVSGPVDQLVKFKELLEAATHDDVIDFRRLAHFSMQYVQTGVFDATHVSLPPSGEGPVVARSLEVPEFRDSEDRGRELFWIAATNDNPREVMSAISEWFWDLQFLCDWGYNFYPAPADGVSVFTEGSEILL
ncbi:hypothetical protein [Aeromicrobium sp. 9AM]|uniref:hypothetical protein n=1 Tax=Aeromicrobium sp. 9AM TaxID=2653126 RepID=UPI0012F1FF07|nr:hypothetical protein [Aeromicrobium sp. 9AM]VXB04379.1 hypothetical protein AERO9AM_10270 [Aeromicrobium sp. 9AM]